MVHPWWLAENRRRVRRVRHRGPGREGPDAALRGADGPQHHGDCFDNGWTKRSTDPWDVVTTYSHNALGRQTARTLTPAGGSSHRTMSWGYHPDGKLKSRSAVAGGLGAARVAGRAVAAAAFAEPAQHRHGRQLTSVAGPVGDTDPYPRFCAVCDAQMVPLPTIASFEVGTRTSAVVRQAVPGGEEDLGRVVGPLDGHGQPAARLDPAGGHPGGSAQFDLGPAVGDQ